MAIYFPDNMRKEISFSLIDLHCKKMETFVDDLYRSNKVISKENVAERRNEK